MARFDFDAYLDRKYGALGQDKIQQLQQARDEKIAALERFGAAVQAGAPQIAARQQASAQSWVGRLGLDPEGAAGALTNLAASIAAGASRQAGQLASLLPALSAIADESSVSEAEIAAYNRRAQGLASADDLALLARKKAFTAERDSDAAKARAQALADRNPDGPTALDLIERSKRARELARGVMTATDAAAIVEPTAREALVRDLGAGFQSAWDQTGLANTFEPDRPVGSARDIAAGLGKLVHRAAEAALTHPQASAEYVFENLPQLAVGAFGKGGRAVLTASNLGYAADNYHQGLQNHARANQGALPSREARQRMARYAASTFLADQVGDLAQLGAIGRLRGAVRSADTGLGAAFDASQAAARSGLRQALLEPVLATAKAGARGAGAEALTEGWQTYAEGEAQLRPVTPEQIYVGAAIGGIAGGGTAGGGRAVLELLGRTPEALAPRQGDAVRDAARAVPRAEAIRAAAASGDVAALVDPESPAYAPDAAIHALSAHARRDGAEPEAPQAIFERASQVVEALHARRQALADQIALRTPAGLQRQIALRREALAGTDPAEAERRAEHEAAIAAFEAQQASLADPKVSRQVRAELRDLERQRTRLDTDLQRSEGALAEFHRQRQPRALDVEAEAAAILAPGAGGDVTSAGRIDPVAAQARAAALINLSMAVPERLEAQTAERLARDPASALTEAQRTYFRAFSEARQAEHRIKDLGRVSSDVYFGSARHVGIQQYRETVAAALSAGDRAAAERQLGRLDAFVQSHRAKAATVTQAWDDFNRDGRARQVRSDGHGGWTAERGHTLGREQRAREGAVLVGDRSHTLVRAIPEEADALAKAHAELQAAFAHRFGAAGQPMPPQAPAGPAADGVTADESRHPQSVSTSTSASASASASATGSNPASDLASDPALQEPSGSAAKAAGTASTEAASSSQSTRLAEPSAAQSRQPSQPIGSAAVEQSSAVENQSNAQASTARTEHSVTSSTTSASASASTPMARTIHPVSPEGTSAAAATGTAARAAPDDSAGSAASDASGLSLFHGRRAEDELPPGTPLGAVYRTINKAVAFLAQTRTRVEHDRDIPRDRPLVSVPQLLSRWNAGEVTPDDFFPEPLIAPEQAALASFREVATRWAPLLRQNLVRGGIPNRKGVRPRADFLYEDPIQDFFAADGAIDENLVTAIAYGAYAWLADAVNGPARKDDEAILQMHGIRDDSAAVSPEGRRVLARYAAFQDAAANAIGRHVVDALGLVATERAPVDYLPKLQTAFGLHALVLLAQPEVDLIDLDTIDGGRLNAYLPGIGFEPVDRTAGRVTNAGETVAPRDVHASMTYVAVRRDAALQLPAASRAIGDAARPSFGVLRRLLSTEPAATTARWTPQPFRQQRASRTEQRIPQRLHRILEQAQQAPHRIIPEMWQALAVLGDAAVLRAAGWQALTEGTGGSNGSSGALAARIQAENRDGVLATNLGLEEQLAAMRAIVQTAVAHSPLALAQPFFVTFDVWRNFRVGIATRDLNPQASKIHRYMFFRPEWRSTIRLDDAAANDAFRLSVAQAFGVKIDQTPNDETLASFDRLVADDDHAIDRLALRLHEAIAQPAPEALTAEALTAAEQARIAAFAAEREGMQTLQALVAYGRWLAAREAGAPEVTVHLLVGVDGKTNGPILTHLALGAAESADALYAQLNRGGMYRAQDGVANFNHWYPRPASRDLYQDLAHRILAGIAPSEALAAISTFTRSLLADGQVTSAGRNLAKTPLTAFVFGSSIARSVEAMKAAFVQSVFDRIEAVATGRDRLTTREQLIGALNRLIGDPQRRIPATTPIAALMARPFSEAERTALGEAFHATIGVRVEGAMRGAFATYLARRNAVNTMIQGGFALFEALERDLHARALERAMEAGDVAYTASRDGRRTPMHDLTIAQARALRAQAGDLLPWAHTAYTAGSDEREAGLYMARTRPAAGTAEHFRVKTLLGRFIPSKNGTGWPVQHIEGRAITRIETGPGVAGLPYFMHALDSYVMHTSLEGTETLNVHDEAANGVARVQRTAQAINRATWEGLLNFSPAGEAFALLARGLQGAAERAASGALSPAALAAIRSSLRALLPRSLQARTPVAQLARVVLERAWSERFEADRVRLEAMAQMTAIDQYTWEGGEYRVSDADRAQAQARLAAHRQQAALDPALLAHAQALGDALARAEADAGIAAGSSAGTSAGTSAAIERDALAEPPGGLSAFGPLGRSLVASDADLVAFFAAHPQPSAAQVMAQLALPGRLDPVHGRLLALLRRTLARADPALAIRYVTPATDPQQLVAPLRTASRGWYVATRDGRTEIFVLSPDFVHSGLTAETLLHELVHAAIARVIADPGDAARPLVDELEALRGAAQAFAQARGLRGFDAAFADLQEFVAWGMTNAAFQRDVLRPLSWTHANGGHRLVTAMQRFVNTLTRLLFGHTDAAARNGLAVLVHNVAGLFHEAAHRSPQPVPEARAAEDAPEGEGERESGDLNLSHAAAAVIDAYTTVELFDALDNGSVSPSFQQHLREVLAGIVQTLHGPFGAFARALRRREAGNPLAVWLKAIETGRAPFASEIVASGFAGSAQEDFAMQQVEATVRAALADDATTTTLYRELSKLYSEARARLTPADFASSADHDFVFRLEATHGDRSDYLARFAALGLANERFRALLAFDTARDTRPLGAGRTVLERLANVFDKLLAVLARRLTGTWGGQRADVKLERLVGQLVDIEARRRHALAMRAARTEAGAFVEARLRGLADAARERIADLAGSAPVRAASSAVVQALGQGVRLVARHQVDAFMESLRRWRDAEFDARDGIAASLLTEFRGPGAGLQALLRATKHLENLRKGVITRHARLTLEAFRDGRSMSRAQKAAITAVFLRTGLHHLQGRFTLAQLEALLGDEAAVDREIDALEAALPEALRARYVEQVNALGYHKATGRVRTPVLMLNAHLIARLAATPAASQVTEAAARAVEPVLAALAALYALKYTAPAALGLAKAVLHTENARVEGEGDGVGAGHGVAFLLQLHGELERESRERLFHDAPALMLHGYTPEITNPYTAIRVAGELEGRDLVDQGYVPAGEVRLDAADPDRAPRRIYVLRDGGLAPWLSGIFSLSSLKARGSALHGGLVHPGTQAGRDNAQRQARVTQAKLAALDAAGDPKRDLRRDRSQHLAPVFDARGAIVNWRYLMTEATRDAPDLLERDSRFDQVMGALAGSIFDKPASGEQNARVVAALKAQYESESVSEARAYVLVGERSTDPELRERWQLLPERTRAEVRSLWGMDALWVRKDALDLVFGYRKYSLGAIFDKDAPNRLERVFADTVEQLLWSWARAAKGLDDAEARRWARRAAVVVTRGERAWQELVRETKDIVVVKSGLVMLGNVWSNVSLLAARGVSLRDLVIHHKVALRGAMAYQADTQRLAELETRRAVGDTRGGEAEMRREIVRLRDAIDRNPVRELIEAGLMPTIVEDVAADEDPYSYRTQLARRTERFTRKFPAGVRRAGRAAYMARDTWMYQSLSRATQLSDFVARYTLFQHLVSRPVAPLDRAQAIQEASDAFVNYDLPMHRLLQYADDMGFMMFTKYFLRIQRVLLKTFQEHPARVLTMVALNDTLGLGPIVLDSAFVHHVGNNPLHWGALQYPTVLDELATVSAPMALLK